MAEAPPTDLISDAELSRQLHHHFVVNKEPEVVIQHPTEGDITYTREEYFKSLAHLKKSLEMSPAERLQESKRISRKQQMRFRTAMITAKTYTVDIDDEDSFGKDVDGNEIDMEGMTFVPVDNYLKGVLSSTNELGAFVDPSMRRPPIRIQTIPVEAAVENDK